MTNLNRTAWVETMTARERLRAVVELLDEPATVEEVGERADVSRSTANRGLERLQVEGLVDLYEVDGEAHVRVDSARLLTEDIERLINSYDRDELESELQTMLDEVEEFREEFGVESAAELSEDQRNVASTLVVLESDISLYRRALRGSRTALDGDSSVQL